MNIRIRDIIFGSIMLLTAITTIDVRERQLANTKSQPCNCPTYKDFISNREKYEMFIDSLQNNGNKNNRNRLIDSIQKYKL